MNMNETVCSVSPAPHEKIGDVIAQTIDSTYRAKTLAAIIRRNLYGECTEDEPPKECSCAQECVEEIRRNVQDTAEILSYILERM